MTIARLAFLTTPGPNRFVLNIQPFGSDEIVRFEIGKAHLANILIDGTALALREQYKPRSIPQAENENERTGA